MSTTECLRGVSNVTVDTKGRIGIPSRYRSDLHELCGGRLVVTVSVDSPSISIYSKPYWAQVEGRLKKPPTNELGSVVRRMALSYSTDCVLDNNGRILLPSSLREDIGIKENCVLLGVGYKFELWNQKNWDEYRGAAVEKVAKKIESGQADGLLEYLGL